MQQLPCQQCRCCALSAESSCSSVRKYLVGWYTGCPLGLLWHAIAAMLAEVALCA